MEFECEYRVFTDQLVSNAYTCGVKRMVKSSPVAKIKSIAGEHQQGKSNEDVKYLEFDNWQSPSRNLCIRVFPRNTLEIFPNLVHLELQFCGLEKVSQKDLTGLENLESLILPYNQLMSLPDNLFADTKKLRFVSLHHNRLERLSSNLIQPIENTVEYFSLAKNVRIDTFFSKKNWSNSNLKKFMAAIDSSCLPPLSSELQEVVDLKACNFAVHEKIFAGFKKFKASNDFSDFTIKVRGKEYKVHKCILAAQCPFFEQMFKSHSDEASKTFTKITNFSDNTFESFLDYFYSGDVKADTNSIEIFELATVFDVPDLKLSSIEKVLDNLDKSNALDVFNLAHKHDSDELKQAAFEKIQEIYPEIRSHLMDIPEQLNKIVKAKQELEKMLADAEKFTIGGGK